MNLQEIVDPIQNVRAHHRDFIDDDRAKLLDHLGIARPYAPCPYGLQSCFDVEAEKAVDRLPCDVDCCDAGRGKNDRLRIHPVSN